MLAGGTDGAGGRDRRSCRAGQTVLPGGADGAAGRGSRSGPLLAAEEPAQDLLHHRGVGRFALESQLGEHTGPVERDHAVGG